MVSRKDDKKISELMEAIIILKTRNEARRFFRDLLTEKELIEFGNRWKTARMLAENVKYTEIEEETGLSSTTIARVSNWLNNGRGGYGLILKRLGLINKYHNPSFVGRGLR